MEFMVQRANVFLMSECILYAEKEETHYLQMAELEGTEVEGIPYLAYRHKPEGGTHLSCVRP
jgi:hypothetical protein